MKTLTVVAALIKDTQGRYLISLRQEHQSHSNKWEFPGGKVEKNESLIEALTREIYEEIGLKINQAEKFSYHNYDYDNEKIQIYFFKVTKYQGEAKGKEGQKIDWQLPKEINKLAMPEVNKQILDKII